MKEWVRFFGLPVTWAQGLPSERDPALSALLEELLAECTRIRSEYTVEVDRAPVMAEEGMYWARLDHRAQKIWVNGYALDRAPDQAQALEFLIHHELVHGVLEKEMLEERSDRFQTLLEARSEEELADLAAIFALQKIVL